MTSTLSPIRWAKIRWPKSAHADADCCTPSSPRDSRRFAPIGCADRFPAQKTRRTMYPPPVGFPRLAFAQGLDRDAVKSKLRDIGLPRCRRSKVHFPQLPTPEFRV